MPFIEETEVKPPCNDKEHYPPSHTVLNPLKRYVWECPACKHQSVIEGNVVLC